jgi:hypothetical protein
MWRLILFASMLYSCGRYEIEIADGFPWSDDEILHAIDFTIGDRDINLALRLSPTWDDPAETRWCGLADGFTAVVNLHWRCTDGTIPTSALVHEVEHCVRAQSRDPEWFRHTEEFLDYVAKINASLAQEAAADDVP